MLTQYASVLFFAVFTFIFVIGVLILAKVLGPARGKSEAKLQSYECGEPPQGLSWLQFNNRFYLVAIAFLIFDVEIAFMFPVARILKELTLLGQGWFALAEILLFALILFVGLIYIWKKGDIDWVKDLQISNEEEVFIRENSPASKSE
jgi:NADH-quinone oxidoreductase subunit A